MALIEILCPTCYKREMRYPGTSYCLICSKARQKVWRKTLVPKTCKGCGESYTAKSSNQRYCTELCKSTCKVKKQNIHWTEKEKHVIKENSRKCVNYLHFAVLSENSDSRGSNSSAKS